ncbi:MAG: alkaline phosphatase family protein [Alphaproteobacteria bacterium]|nr:alkaline phosphatase family protein [Alphaproteobacteria bacterium]
MGRPVHFPAHLPDYGGNGFVNLIASLVEAGGGAPRHAPLAALPAAELREARNVVFLILDGLGDNYLAANGGDGPLARHRRGSISAVFPSTTASAITTSFTGATPLEHGLTGWFTYFSAAACVGAALPFVRRGEKAPLAAAPERIFVAPPLFYGLAVRSLVVSWRQIIDSTYNRHHCGRTERLPYDDLEGLLAQTVAAVKSGPERKLVYAYWPEFDALAHQHGVASAPVRAHFSVLDVAFGELLARLAGTDTLVVATADHGFMDSPAGESIELPPALAAMLRFPLCGERRVAFCHVHDRKSFMQAATEILGERADVRASEELVAEGWFGPGSAHPLLSERVGDVALVMNGRGTIKDWVAGEARHLHIGNHGGTSEDEMRIPLVVAKA